MALERLFDAAPDVDDAAELYTRIAFPDPPDDRPYVFVNMVSTADGKTIIGEPGGTAQGVGGPTDQALFRRLQFVGDAAMIGGTTLRASTVLYPPEKPRIVVTRTGDVPLGNRFFTDAPDRAYVLAPEDLSEEAAQRIEASARLLRFGRGGVNLRAALAYLRREMGIRHLLCEGGATLNFDLLRDGLMDELFLTVAPKLKGGARLPTVVDGEGFAPGRFAALTLRSLYRDGDEVYFRYRVESVA